MLMANKNGRTKFKMKFKLSWKDFIIWGALVFFGFFFLLGLVRPVSPEKTVPLSTVLSDIKEGKVEELVVSGERIEVKAKTGEELFTYKEQDSNIYQILKDAGIEPAQTKITVKDEAISNVWINVVSSLLPVLLMVLFFLFLFRQARGAQESIFSFGTSRARLFNKDTPKTTFTDVAGVDEAKQELTEVVDFLKNPGKYKAIGARTPKGALLIGPSGTGKTLLARAVAGEANVPFFSISGSEFMEMLVGVGAARVRDLFNTAKKAQPSIIFIDEVDAIGRQRGVGIMGGHDEREQTLNQILVEMDGFTPNENVIVMAATNRPDILDPALVRPGRFDRRVMLDMPDIEGRKSILKIHAKGKPFTKNLSWEKVAKRTVGFSGADLENMLNEAAILTARVGKKEIGMLEVEEAATKVKLGPERKRLQSDEDRRMTAYHEAGHALVSFAMPHIDPVHRISIVSRGLSLGHTLIPPTTDRLHETKTHLLEQVSVMLGGRAAENLIFREMTTGAADDIAKATEVARTMVVEYGMSELGPINLSPDNDPRLWRETSVSPDMAAKIDSEVKRIVDSCYKRSAMTLTKLRKRLDVVARELIKKETLEGKEFERLVGAKRAFAKVLA